MDHSETKTAAAVANGHSRRKALKIVGAAALTVPVIETLTGKDLMNISVQAQTVVLQGFGGPFAGSVDEEAF